MKKLFVSTGLAVIGVAGLQSAGAAGPDLISPKAWNVSGTLRGFYDDNYAIGTTKKGSWGLEVSPQISINVPLQQTDLGIRYYYSLYYYDDRREFLGWNNSYDQSHQVEFWMNHAFNPNWKLKVTDHVGIGQEPDLLQPNPTGGQAIPYRINGNNIANYGNVSLDGQWTRNFGTSLSYANNYFDYDNNGATVTGGLPTTGLGMPPARSAYNGPGVAPGWRTIAGGASRSGLLDRIEQNIALDFSWTFSPETKVSIGYGFNQVNYIGNEPIAVFNYDQFPFIFGVPGNYSAVNPKSFVYYSNNRDSRSHNGHVSLNHQLTANISLALSAGVSYNDSYNDPIQHTTSLSPSASASLSYTYIPGSYVQLGVNQGENSTDVVAPGSNGSLTQYQHSTTVYADWNHRITEKLSGTLIARFNYATFEGGAANAMSEEDYNLGLNFSYKFNRHFSADVGYNFDDLVTSLSSRGFIRNRVYLGLTASY